MTTITKGLLSLEGVLSVNKIDNEAQTIDISTRDEMDLELVYNKLNNMGYPKPGENNLFEKSKSMVSCAIGKLG
jgi:hypothetical protein